MSTAVLDSQRCRLQQTKRRLDQLSRTWWRDATNRVLLHWRDTTPCVCFVPDMTRDDERLIAKWNRPNGEERRDWYERVVSARRAEKAVLSYFEQFGVNVQDISIHQISGESLAWRSHDLTADGRSIDVKNVRGRALGYTIPDRPKRDATNDEVAIFGVVSDGCYATAVGEASRRGLDELGHTIERFAEVTQLPLAWQRMARWKNGLGAWLMEFPPQHYKHGRGVVEAAFLDADYRKLVESIGKAEELEGELGPIPTWISGLASFHCGRNPKSGGSAVIGALAKWHECARTASEATTRPALFLFSLLFLLAAVKHRRWKQDRTRQELLGALFANDTEFGHQHPMGLHDPRKTIHELILIVDRLILKNRDLLEQVEELRLSGMGVLRGRRRGKKEFTLLAYCGGCGKTPIWAGNLEELHGFVGEREPPQRHVLGAGVVEEGCRLCMECLYLVCDECGFCKADCPRCPTPQRSPRLRP